MVRPSAIDEAEILFFDEPNRASSCKVVNALLELIRNKSVNGARLLRLKVVVAAINPDEDDYQVRPLDRAFMDRFPAHLHMDANPDPEWYQQNCGVGPSTAASIVDWWREDLDDGLRRLISPRRLEYVARAYAAHLPLENFLPIGVPAPISHLIARLEGGSRYGFPLDARHVEANQAYLAGKIVKDPDLALTITEVFIQNQEILPRAIDLFLALPSDHQGKILALPVANALRNLVRNSPREDPRLRALGDRLKALGVLR
jgi:hypothetical protein